MGPDSVHSLSSVNGHNWLLRAPLESGLSSDLFGVFYCCGSLLLRGAGNCYLEVSGVG